MNMCIVTLSIGYLSTLSDYFGRKFIFRLSTFGIILGIANIIIVAHCWRIVGIRMLYVGSIIQGLLGGVIAINTACHAYISDCTNSENRSVAFGLMHASAFCGMAIGPTFGGLIEKVRRFHFITSKIYLLIYLFYFIYKGDRINSFGILYSTLCSYYIFFCSFIYYTRIGLS
jgi:hypothetical protein